MGKYEESGALGLINAFLEEFAPKDGFSEAAIENFYVFLQEGNFVMDNRPVVPDAFPWLEPFYRITRTDIYEGKYKHGIVLYKAAQMGASVAMMLFIIWLCLGPTGLIVALFFPTQDDLRDMVQARMNPMIVENKRLEEHAGGAGADNTRLKQIKRSTVYFRHTGGKITADSISVDVLIADEVRYINTATIERTQHRMRQSNIKLRIYASTAGKPDDYMERAYYGHGENPGSNRMEWHSYCPGCDHTRCVHKDPRPAPGREDVEYDGVVVSDLNIPDFIRRTESGAEYFCKYSGERIDLLNGGYQEHNPGEDRSLGLHFPAVLAPAVDPKEVLDAFETNVDLVEFWNSFMGRSYASARGRLVTFEQAEATKDSMLDWPRDNWTLTPTYMGVDCRTEELHVTIINENRIVHVEVLQGEQTYERLTGLMNAYSVRRCVIDYRPHTSITLPFCRANRNRVYLADYRKGERYRLKAGAEDPNFKEDVQETNLLMIDRLDSIKYALGLFAAGQWKMPEARKEQSNFKDRKKRVHDVYDVAAEFRTHMQNLAVVEQSKHMIDEPSGQRADIANETVEEIANIDFDPHFAHSFNYAVAAMLMMGGSVEVLADPRRRAAQRAAEAKAKLGEVGAIFSQKNNAEAIGNAKVCGNCQWMVKDDNDVARCSQMNGARLENGDFTPACTYPGMFRRRTK